MRRPLRARSQHPPANALRLAMARLRSMASLQMGERAMPSRGTGSRTSKGLTEVNGAASSLGQTPTPQRPYRRHQEDKQRTSRGACPTARGAAATDL